MLYLFAISLLWQSSVYSAKFKCFESGELRVVKNNKKIIFKKPFCTNHHTYDIVSISCIKDSKCQAIQKYKYKRPIPFINARYGNPHHRKCYLLGGRPQIIEYRDGKSWKQNAICNFDDSSFISVFNLIR